MKSHLLCGAAVLLFLTRPSLPAGAEAAHERHHRATVAHQTADHRPVRLVAIQHPTWGRLTFLLEGNPRPAIVRHPDGVELRFASGTVVTVPATERLRQIAAIDLTEVDGAPVALVRLACDCAMTIENPANLLRLDVRENRRHPGERPPASNDAAEMAALRNTLAAKIAALNAPPPGEAPNRDSAAAATAPAAPPSPPPICLPPVDMTAWHNNSGFAHQLQDLRANIGYSQGGTAYLAALAEFYLSYGLGGEALAVASDALTSNLTPDERIRLMRDADIAHLLNGEQLDASSPLLATPPGCDRADAPLWRALAAAAANDAEGAARNADGARLALLRVPEPLLQQLAYRVAGAVTHNSAALLAMIGAVRNAKDDVPEDEAARFLLQARVAELAHDEADYAALLERAAQDDLTVPGIIAKAKLAALRAGQEGPGADHAEAVLADVARTYRFEPLGQQAAQSYAERRMRHGDYVAALAMADASAGPDGPGGERSGASVGAVLAARILRILLVDPDKAGLPDSAERLALYWRYPGYATPGVAGDDIRAGAARLMMMERLPDAALGVLKQVADSTATKPDVMLLRAEAEARAGDPSVALTMLPSLPDDDAAHRIAADALERMGRFADAADRLRGATSVADQERRAGLLFKAAAWQDAAAAYADLLHASGLAEPTRAAAAERYAVALALAGKPAPVGVPQLPELPSRLLSVLPAAAPATPASADALAAMRSALQRSKRIEGLLDPAPADQGS